MNLRAGTPQGFSSNRASDGLPNGFLSGGPNTKKRGKMLTGNFFSPNIERQKMTSPLLNNHKFGNAHAASVSPNSQESKTGGSNPQPLIYNKDILNGYQQRLQKFATVDGSKGQPDPKKAQQTNAALQTTKENFSPNNQEYRPSSPLGNNENIRTTAGSSSLFTGIQSAKMFHSPQLGKQTFGGQMSSSRYREPLKPLSPQLDRQKNIGGGESDTSKEHDNSYIKRMKQALQEKNPSSGNRQESPKPVKEGLSNPSDIFSLRKLKEMTSGKLLSSNLVTSPLMGQQKDHSSLSATSPQNEASNPDHSQKQIKSAMILNFNSGPMQNNESSSPVPPLLGLHSTQPSLLGSTLPQGHTPKSQGLLMPSSLRPSSQTPRQPGVLVPREQIDTSTTSLSATAQTKDRTSSRTPSQTTPGIQTGNFLLMQPTNSGSRPDKQENKEQRDKGSALLSNLFTTLMSSQPQVVMANNLTTADSSHPDNDLALEVNIEAAKSSRMRLLASAEEAVLNVCKLIMKDKQDPYEAIRAYSEIAQDTQFNLVEVKLILP
jgi:hypothetical protein